MQADGGRVRVLVVDDDKQARDSIRDLLALESWIQPVGLAATAEEAISLAARLVPDVILLDYFMPGSEPMLTARRLSEVAPKAALVMISVETGTEIVRAAMVAGAKDFLSKPFAPSELYDVVRRVYAPPGEGVGVAAAEPQGAEIVTVHSPKGGVGVTTLATSLAVAKRQQSGARVALVDLSLPYGDVGVVMDLVSPATLYDLCVRVQELDAALLADVLVTHPSGVKVLLAPADPQQAETVGAAQVRTILALMAEQFEYIFIDTAHDLADVTLTALDVARRVVVVGTQDVTAVRDVKQFLELTQLLDYEDDKVHLVLNRLNSYTRLSPASIEKRLGVSVLGSIPEDLKAFASAVADGVPVVQSHRGSAGAREIIRIADSLRAQQAGAEGAGEAAGRRGRFSLFSRTST